MIFMQLSVNCYLQTICINSAFMALGPPPSGHRLLARNGLAASK